MITTETLSQTILIIHEVTEGKRKMLTVYPTVILLLLISTAKISAITTPSVCSTVEKLTRATSPIVQVETASRIFNVTTGQIIPDNKTSSNSTDRLRQLYSFLAAYMNTTVTVVGFNKFVEVVNEISVAKDIECNKLSFEREDIHSLIEEFRSAFKEKDEDLHRIRLLYGKLLCIAESDGARVRRQDYDCERKCPPEGLDGEFFCIEELFACLDPGNKLTPVFGFRNDQYGEQCLAFLVDTTGSMRDEIEVTKSIINEFILREEELGFFGCYMLVPFNDINDTRLAHVESVGPVTVAHPNFYPNSILDLINAVNNLTADGGGDSNEYALYAMLVALREEADFLGVGSKSTILQEGSQMIVLTDAPSKQEEYADAVIYEANLLKVCIHFFLNGIANYDELYVDISEKTGGHLSNSFTNYDLATFISTYKENPCSSNGDVRYERLGKREVRSKRSSHINYYWDTSNSMACGSFKVSKLAALLKLSIEARANDVRVTDPEGNESLFPVRRNLAVFSKELPHPGLWSACVDIGRIKITKTEDTLMDASFFYQSQETLTITYSPVPPPANFRGTVVIISSKSSDITSATLSMVDRTGETVRSIEMSVCSGSLVSNTVDFPLGSFTYRIDGVDTNGVHFRYNTEKNVTFKPDVNVSPFTMDETDAPATTEIPIAPFIMEGPTTAEMDCFDTLTLNYILHNNVLVDSEFIITRRRVSHFASRLSSTTVLIPAGGTATLSLHIRCSSPTIRPGTNHVFEVVATNPYTTLSVSTEVTIKQPASPTPMAMNLCGCLNGGTCIQHTIRGRTLRRCTCPPNYRGGQCQINISTLSLPKS